MLRLRPSELALTPEDVEEAFRLMARKQSEKATRNASLQSRTQPEQVVARPGAQRTVHDAITTLGDIPTLWPQPQQAVLAHVDDEDATYVQPSRATSAASVPAPPPASVSLPFRIGRRHADTSAPPAQTEHQAGERPEDDQADSPPATPGLRGGGPKGKKGKAVEKYLTPIDRNDDPTWPVDPNDPPALYLRGYFNDPLENPNGTFQTIIM